MKISALEKGVLALTAAFILLTVGYFLGQRSDAKPYTISAQTLWTTQVRDNGEHTSKVAQPVNINTADVSQLQSLPGIGQLRAEAIVAEREANGPFRIPEDITRVSGIGQGTMEEILDYITVN